MHMKDLHMTFRTTTTSATTTIMTATAMATTTVASGARKKIVVVLGTTASNHPTGTSTTWNAAARASQMSTSSYHHPAICPWQAQQHHHSLAHLRHLPAVPPDSPKPLQAAMPDSPPELSPVAPPPAASPAASDLPHSNPPADSCLLPERGVRAWVVTHVALHRQRRAANHPRCDPARSAEGPVAVGPVPVTLAVAVAGGRVAVRTPGKLVTSRGPVPMAQRRAQGHHHCLASSHRCGPSLARPLWTCVDAAHLWPSAMAPEDFASKEDVPLFLMPPGGGVRRCHQGA